MTIQEFSNKLQEIEDRYKKLLQDKEHHIQKIKEQRNKEIKALLDEQDTIQTTETTGDDL